MHTAATATLTAYHIDSHGHGVEAVKALGILPRFTGVAVHDAYAGYDGFAGCAHTLCNAHAVREPAAIAEFDAVARDGWAAEMIGLLGEAHRWSSAWHRKGHTPLAVDVPRGDVYHINAMGRRGIRCHHRPAINESSPGRSATSG
ncbi:transposase [Actinomadura sp. LD22]|uniref:Transposase n=1 Tax=Actinomadura physcomitrii TaxID=2650748 RepID=A0A6I4MTP4_9ACTN|nr:transposase [Actinomadura physcomitrii]